MAWLQMDLARPQLYLQSTKIRSYHCGVWFKFLVWNLHSIALNPILDGGGGQTCSLIQLRNCQVKEAETLSLLAPTYNTPFEIILITWNLWCCHDNAISKRPLAENRA